MKLLRDYKGRNIRLPDERIRHFSARLVRAGMYDLLEDTVTEPDFIIQSRSDPKAAINYKFHRVTKGTDKYLCVVVKYEEEDAYVLTAYPSDQIKKGNLLWERKKK
ncbi:MAG: PBECR2 nuclease fold domain-containing protein [Ignavibacteriota bacterium]